MSFKKANELLASWGVPVRVYDSQAYVRKARSDIAFVPEMIINHHTAAWATSDKMLFINGNGNVPAPLCHYTIYEDGTVVFGAGGYANHAGSNNKAAVEKVKAGGPTDSEIKPAADTPDYSANRRSIGIEVKCPGSYNAIQRQHAVLLNTALVLAFGWSTSKPPVGAHKEITTRKPGDPGDDMGKFREDVIATLAEKSGAPVPKPVVTVPKFPLTKGWYFGPKTGPKESVSGYFAKRAGGKKGHEGLLKWQKEANAKGYKAGAPDGLWGTNTSAATKAVQKKHGLPQNGRIDVKTWNALFSEEKK